MSRTTNPPLRLPGGVRALVAVFLALSALDLLLTWQLLETPGACFYEANPVAGWVLGVGGWWGLVLFKAGCAAAVLSVVTLLARGRPVVARRLLACGCPVLGLVVGYSAFLMVANGSERRDLHEAAERARELEVTFAHQREFKARLYRLGRAVAFRQMTLAQAVQTLNDYLATTHFDPMHPLRTLYDSLPDEACLAAALVREVGFVAHDHRLAESPLPRLRAEFASTYG